MAPLIWFVATLIPLLVLVRWVHRHLIELTFLLTDHKESTIYIYAILLLPGVALHELSHYVAARFLGVRVYEVSLRPTVRRNRSVRLGFVRMRRPDALRGLLIGLAPLVVGSLVVVLIGQQVFDLGVAVEAARSGEPAEIWAFIKAAFDVPDAWIWFYLIFAISNAMLPSPADREGLWAVVAFVGLALALAIGADWGPDLLAHLVEPTNSALTLLTAAFAVTLFVDAIFLAIFLALKWLVGHLFGRTLA